MDEEARTTYFLEEVLTEKLAEYYLKRRAKFEDSSVRDDEQYEGVPTKLREEELNNLF